MLFIFKVNYKSYFTRECFLLILLNLKEHAPINMNYYLPICNNVLIFK